MVSEISDDRLVKIMIGAVVGGLPFLYGVGPLGGILGAAAGAVVAIVVVDRAARRA
jgi:hypothetical protein